MKKEDLYIQATGAEKTKYEMIARTVFEAYVIYEKIAPAQRRQIMRGNLKSLINDFHSNEVKKFIKSYEPKNSDGIGNFIISLTLLVLSRSAPNEIFNQELAKKSMEENKGSIVKKLKIN